jgi:hypothetical protein
MLSACIFPVCSRPNPLIDTLVGDTQATLEAFNHTVSLVTLRFFLVYNLRFFFSSFRRMTTRAWCSFTHTQRVFSSFRRMATRAWCSFTHTQRVFSSFRRMTTRAWCSFTHTQRVFSSFQPAPGVRSLTHRGLLLVMHTNEPLFQMARDDEVDRVPAPRYPHDVAAQRRGRESHWLSPLSPPFMLAVCSSPHADRTQRVDILAVLKYVLSSRLRDLKRARARASFKFDNILTFIPARIPQCVTRAALLTCVARAALHLRSGRTLLRPVKTA